MDQWVRITGTMLYEVEQKFAVADIRALEAALAELGATAQGAVEQVDRYFAHPARNFAETDEALRIRRAGEENFVTYKGPRLDATTKTRQELELPLMRGEAGLVQFSELLQALGFSTVAEVRKTRRTFNLRSQERDCEVALDEVAGLGAFVELELMVAADALESAQAALAALASRLKLSAPERRSYLEMQLALTDSAAVAR